MKGGPSFPEQREPGGVSGGGVAVQLARDGETLVFSVAGDLTAHGLERFWNDGLAAWAAEPSARLVFDASGIRRCDGAGISFLLEIEARQLQRGGQFEIRHWPESTRALLDAYRRAAQATVAGPATINLSWVARVGRRILEVRDDIHDVIVFVGELTLVMGRALIQPASVRWRDVGLGMEKAGVNALPIIGMLGFLIGLIIAFQSAIPMRRYGADIFVPSLVALGLFRELGPLITAIILAGRSGASFAAELGAMKVNEEVNALITLGIQPVRFLALPRVLATIIVTPLLTMFANVFGLAGAAVVTLSLGYPMATFINQVVETLSVRVLMMGLSKSLVFGLMIAAIGCLRGLQTASGAGAVGNSTTRAVVSGIVLIVVADGLFAVLFYGLGI